MLNMNTSIPYKQTNHYKIKYNTQTTILVPTADGQDWPKDKYLCCFIVCYTVPCTIGFVVTSNSAGTRSQCKLKSTLPFLMNQGNQSICIQITQTKC
jgi:hypothetical protein